MPNPLTPEVPPPPVEKKVVTFGTPMSPEDSEDLKNRIQQARATGSVDSLKKRTPLGHIEKPQMPILRPGPDTEIPFSDNAAAAGVKPRPAGAPPVRPQTVAQVQAFEKA